MADCRRAKLAIIEPTGSRFMCRWRVAYYGLEHDAEHHVGMVTETLHFTLLGARLSRWLWR